MPNQVKFSSEVKLQIVELFLTGAMNLSALSAKYAVHTRTISDWVWIYENRGTKGLSSATVKNYYSPELKRQAVTEYLSGPLSLREICAKYGISDKKTLQEWMKVYNSSHESYRKPRKPMIGGIGYMAKGRKTTLEERIEIVGYCIANDKDYGKAAELYGVSYGQLHYWVRKYEHDGIDALSDRRGKHKNKDSMTETELLHAQLKLKDAELLQLRMETDLLKKLAEVERRRR